MSRCGRSGSPTRCVTTPGATAAHGRRSISSRRARPLASTSNVTGCGRPTRCPGAKTSRSTVAATHAATADGGDWTVHVVVGMDTNNRPKPPSVARSDRLRRLDRRVVRHGHSVEAKWGQPRSKARIKAGVSGRSSIGASVSCLRVRVARAAVSDLALTRRGMRQSIRGRIRSMGCTTWPRRPGVNSVFFFRGGGVESADRRESCPGGAAEHRRTGGGSAKNVAGAPLCGGSLLGGTVELGWWPWSRLAARSAGAAPTSAIPLVGGTKAPFRGSVSIARADQFMGGNGGGDKGRREDVIPIK